ncbi:MAG: type II toxin-antitoxin system prevent-host-death family antitoxin [Chloroflexota bacterium]
MKVGIRELKARLSEYIERAQAGEVIDVTSRGRRVAQIVPAPGSDNVERGLTEGWITRREERAPSPTRRYRPRFGTASTTELIRADRDA